MNQGSQLVAPNEDNISRERKEQPDTIAYFELISEFCCIVEDETVNVFFDEFIKTG